ncbi:hypothetical protein [Litorisediminicola beolgyonensis]|uniref:Small CPxCG-related zinc finger protein n=1 Tax=Litorisediminicola beolgyonensis TaxID=1173614 RepID=A0ABW3ZMP3_9RHOB
MGGIGQLDCVTHGRVAPAFVCRHLATARRDGRSPGVTWLRGETGHVNAWCEECDAVLDAHGGVWDDETEGHAGITMICEPCFDELKRTNAVKDLN